MPRGIVTSHSTRMSFPNNVDFSEIARGDIADILRYTSSRWGSAQTARYRIRLNRAIALISEFQFIGHELAELMKPCRAYSFGSHVIFYQQVENRVVILRVLHQQMTHKDHL